MFKELEHKKLNILILNPRHLADSQTIKAETQAVNDKFSQIKRESDKVNNAVTQQKIQTDAINLVNDILDDNNPYKNIGTESIWIEDNLFDNNDRQAVKNISKEILDTTNPINDIISIDGDIPIEIDNEIPIETITIEDGIEIPSDDGMAILTPKKSKNNNYKCKSGASCIRKIKKIYLRQKSRPQLKKVNKKVANWLRKAGCLETDDSQTVDYNNDTNITDLDDVETINYSNDTNIYDLNDLYKTDFKNNSGSQMLKKLLKNPEIQLEKNPTKDLHLGIIITMILLI